MHKWIAIFVVAISTLCPSAPASADAPRGGRIIKMAESVRQLQAEREAIKQMPLANRPNRPGHIYGNNVRRVRHGRVFVNRTRRAPSPLGF